MQAKVNTILQIEYDWCLPQFLLACLRNNANGVTPLFRNIIRCRPWYISKDEKCKENEEKCLIAVLWRWQTREGEEATPPCSPKPSLTRNSISAEMARTVWGWSNEDDLDNASGWKGEAAVIKDRGSSTDSQIQTIGEGEGEGRRTCYLRQNFQDFHLNGQIWVRGKKNGLRLSSQFSRSKSHGDNVHQ